MPIANELFGRVWSLSIGTRQWSDLRVVFEIQKTLGRHPNPAQITIYNLARSTRDSFARGDAVRLVAGYEGQADLVYAGDLVETSSLRDGADWATTVSCSDGARAWRANERASYRNGANVATVVESLAKSMGLAVAPGSLAVLAGSQVRGSLVQVGQAARSMQTLLEPLGLSWSIQDGALQLIQLNGTTTEEAVLLSPETGLVGSPEKMGSRGTASKRDKVRATSLLQGTLRPGRQVKLQSEQLSGYFRVNEVLHKGDSHGDEWYSETILQGA